MDSQSIKEKIDQLRKDIPIHVDILAASKKKSIVDIQQAIDAGITLFGENYVQEAGKKAEVFKKNNVQLHLIGHLQRNKVSRAIRIFDCIQTVDTYELAVEIDKYAENEYPVLIQVNIGKEKQKFGVYPENVEELIGKISVLKKLKIQGLMCIAPYSDDQEIVRKYYKKMEKVFCEVKGKNIPNIDMKILSMGMSHDYQVAIKEGSTVVRLGTSIFGSRN